MQTIIIILMDYEVGKGSWVFSVGASSRKDYANNTSSPSSDPRQSSGYDAVSGYLMMLDDRQSSGYDNRIAAVKFSSLASNYFGSAFSKT